jgi:hypothetical protein
MEGLAFGERELHPTRRRATKQYLGRGRRPSIPLRINKQRLHRKTPLSPLFAIHAHQIAVSPLFAILSYLGWGVGGTLSLWGSAYVIGNIGLLRKFPCYVKLHV